MRVDVHLHIEPGAEVSARLDEISQKLSLIIEKENLIMAAIDDALTQAEAAAKANSDADDSAEKLLVTISKMIADLKASGTDPATLARITALATALNSRAARLGAAVVANTPAAPTPTP
jgi:hypothetical protein